jgi:hypothetical protein
MTSSAHGASISQPEVTNIDRFGVWILIRDHEYFLSFEEFPWFRRATLEQVLYVESPNDEHLHWPELDVDLSLDSIRSPESFPLKARTTAYGS